MEDVKEKGEQNNEQKEENQEIAETKSFKVSDKRFWKKREAGKETEEPQKSEYPTYIEELKASIEELKGKKEESERKLLDYIQAFKKAQTENEQFRERLKRDVEKKVAAGKRELFTRLLDMMDNLDRAISSAKNIGNSSALLDGVIISRDLFLSILKREGVERMDVLGKPFDPGFAEAVMVQELDDPSKADVIVEEIQSGYAFNDQILRPAKVKVGKLSGKNENKPEEQK